MSVKLADTLAPMSDFPVAEAKDVDIDINGTHKDLQTAYEDGDLGGGSDIQVTTMPLPSIDNLGQILQYVGANGTYTNGYFYQCVSDGQDPATYSWEQKNIQPSNATASDVSYDNTTSELEATNVQGAIDEIKDSLGTASTKDFTSLVRPDSHDLVESGSVYSAINNALSAIYTPRGNLSCADLTSALLIEANVGNVYQMSDSGLTSALFINGAGISISAGDNVGIIKAGETEILFNYMGNAFDLHDYQKKELTTPILGEDTVEGALGVIAEKDKRIWIGHKTDWDLLTTAEKIVYDEAHFDDDEGNSTYHIGSELLKSVELTSDSEAYSLLSGKSFSDYSILIFEIAPPNGTIRNTIVVPLEEFISKGISIMAIHGSNAEEISKYKICSITCSYVSDTSFRSNTLGSGQINKLTIYGIR